MRKRYLKFPIIGILFLAFGIPEASGTEMILYPDSFKGIHLGMEYSELKKALPESRDLAKQGSDRNAVIVKIKDSNYWDSAMFDVRGSRVVVVNLMWGVEKKGDIAILMSEILDKGIKQFGADYKTKVIDGIGSYNPLIIWEKEDMSIYLNYVPKIEIEKGKRGSIRMVYAKPGIKITEIFAALPPEKMEEALFDLLIDDTVGNVLRRESNKNGPY